MVGQGNEFGLGDIIQSFFFSPAEPVRGWIIGAGPALLLALLAVVLTRALLARAFRQRLGGYTGDCMGAAQQISETLWYLAVCAVLYAGAPGLN